MKYDVCVFGGCSLDIMFYSDGTMEIVPGGKGSNQAVAASRAGAKTTIITKLGSINDSHTTAIIKNLKDNGVDISNILTNENVLNDVNKIDISPNGDNNITSQQGAIDSFDEEMVDRFKDVILNSKVVVIQFKMPKNVSKKLIDFCYQNKIPVVMTPCRPKKLDISIQEDLELLNKISIITCNEKECKTIFKTDNIGECIRKYPNKLIVTLGEKGAVYFDGVNTIYKPSVQISDEEKVIDTTGAGDTLNGNLVAALLQGYTLDEALERAMYASTMKIQKKTAQAGMPTQEELDNYISGKKTKK